MNEAVKIGSYEDDDYYENLTLISHLVISHLVIEFSSFACLLVSCRPPISLSPCPFQGSPGLQRSVPSAAGVSAMKCVFSAACLQLCVLKRLTHQSKALQTEKYKV